jgi:hypothetical protein
MSGTTTPNYHFSLPTIGGNQDTWGNLLNANWTAADSAIHGLASGYLPIAGGTISGNLGVSGNLWVSGSLGVSGTLAVNGSRIVSTGANNSPSISVWNTTANWAGGFWVAAAGAIQFGLCAGNGTPSTPYGYLSSTSLGFAAGTVSITVNAGANSMCYGDATDFNVPGQAWKPGGGPWAATSDDRVKRNVQPYQAGLADICELAPIRFEYNGDGGTTDDGVTRYGLSAQATQPIMPELVHVMPVSRHTLPGQLATDLGPLTLALVNAIRELAERVAALEALRLA